MLGFESLHYEETEGGDVNITVEIQNNVSLARDVNVTVSIEGETGELEMTLD